MNSSKTKPIAKIRLCTNTFCFLIIAVYLLTVQSCVSYENILNYQRDLQFDTTVIENLTEIRIQPNDVLDIKVFSSDMETAAPFNLGPIDNYRNNGGNIESIQLSGYLVDAKGEIDFPVLGKVSLGGVSTSEAKQVILEQLNRYLKDPVVNIRLLNFKISVTGEVARPGIFNIINERITLPEAIGRAGDFTNYADRTNVLLIREIDGVRSFHNIDMQTAGLFKSETYFLKQNDHLYIQPLKAKTGAIGDQTNETISFVVSGATLIAVIVGILAK